MAHELQAKIAEIASSAQHDLKGIDSLSQAKLLRVQYLGKQGLVTELLKQLRDCSPEERPSAGKAINDLKSQLETSFDHVIAKREKSEAAAQIARTSLDLSLPGRRVRWGHRHPVGQVLSEIVAIFNDLGFSAYEGNEIETDYYNFEALNIPKDHPARDMQDTFYIDDGKFLLRTHTSPVQIHVMEQRQPPLAMIAPGAVYRRDSDITHSPMFHQVEGLMVDVDVTFADLKGVLAHFCHEMFGRSSAVRFRPSFFPFTEPSAEIDIACVICKGEGCRVCKQSGWLEILGAGMVDPAVFEAVSYDPEKVSGFAFGMGIERVAMLKFGITDIRLFFENDLRFLEQF